MQGNLKESAMGISRNIKPIPTRIQNTLRETTLTAVKMRGCVTLLTEIRIDQTAQTRRVQEIELIRIKALSSRKSGKRREKTETTNLETNIQIVSGPRRTSEHVRAGMLNTEPIMTGIVQRIRERSGIGCYG